MNENNKPLVAQVRYAWVDYSKAILIFLMVLGHSSMPETIKTYFYAFHMPAFFVISGFLYKPKPFWYTTLSFFVPVVIFSFFIYLIYILNGDFESTREKYVIMLFPGFWFIETLYIIRLFAGDFFNRLKFRKNSIFYIMSLIIIIFLSFTSALEEVNSTICRILACFPFWTFGYYLKKSNVKFLNKQYSYIIMLICLLITHFYGRCDVGGLQFGYSYLCYFIMACFMSFCFFGMLQNVRQNYFVFIISTGTLVVLGVHRIILALFHRLDLIHPLFQYFSWILGSIFVLLISYVLILVLMKYFPPAVGILKRKNK